MRLSPSALPDVYVIEVEPLSDARGFFARVFDAGVIEKAGLVASFPQWSISFNAARATLRGLHWQAYPFEEAKLVRCTQGAIFDVVVDVRARSATRGRWTAVELSAENRKTLYIPPGFAHGFQTLTDGSEVLYHISEPYRPEAARGVRWDDPDIGIEWPEETAPRIISERDRTLPFLRDL